MPAVTLTERNPLSIPGIGDLPARTALGWQITTDTVGDAYTALRALVQAQGFVCNVRIYPLNSAQSSAPYEDASLITIERKDFATLEATDGSWIVFDGVTPTTYATDDDRRAVWIAPGDEGDGGS